MKYHFCNSLSWESGQDVSSRFGPQQTGGTIIQHVRPVDLQASMAQGASILARWGERPWVNNLILAFSLPLLGLFTVLFADWYWVA